MKHGNLSKIGGEGDTMIITVFLVFLRITQIGADAINLNLDKAEEYNLMPLNLAKNGQIISIIGEGKAYGKYFFVANSSPNFLYFEYTNLVRLQARQSNMRGYLDRGLFVTVIDDRKGISPTVTFLPSKNPTADPKSLFGVVIKITRPDYLTAKEALPAPILEN